MKRLLMGAAACAAALSLVGCAGGSTVMLEMTTTADSATAEYSIDGVTETVEFGSTETHGVEFRGDVGDIEQFTVTAGGPGDVSCRITVDGEETSHIFTESDASDADASEFASVTCVPSAG